MLRYKRIVKHSLYYLFTFSVIHKWEIEHYYYMKSFKI